VIAIAATDNRNRTGQEIKGLFDKGGGGLAGPGAVGFNFEAKGFLLIEKKGEVQSQLLKLIDLGVEDMEETDRGIEVYVEPGQLFEFKKKSEQAGFKTSEASIIQDPKSLHSVENSQKAITFLQNLEDHDDIQAVFANADI